MPCCLRLDCTSAESRPTSRTWLTSLPGQFLDPGAEARIAQRLILVPCQPDVINRRPIEIGAAMAAVDLPDVTPAPRHDESGDGGCTFRRKQQVHVVDHQY